MKRNSLQHIISSQWIKLSLLIIAVLLGFTLLIYLMMEPSSSSLTDNIKSDPAHFTHPYAHLNTESTLLEKTQKQLHEAEKKTDSLQQQLDAFAKSNHSEELSNRIAALEKEMTAAQKEKPASLNGAAMYQGNLIKSAPSDAMSYLPINKPLSIREDSLLLSANTSLSHSPTKNPDTYVPAGTFVKAIMLGGSDAPAAVMAQSNPETMVFRLIANGTLPNHKKSHLKDCVVVASVVGDISSERGRIKAESISCTFPNNEVVDQDVNGWVFGADGKFGVRGTPVWREGALLQRAFAAGTLSGFSEGLSKSYTSSSITSQGNVETVNAGKIIPYGFAKGSEKAMDRLANYNIQRAEQYHPIIQISAGAMVDIVFIKGFYLDGKKHETSTPMTEQSPTPSLFQTVPNEEARTLPLTPEMVKRIQEKSKELGFSVTGELP